MENKSKKVLSGVVVSNKSTNTLVVKIERRFIHKRYKKTITLSKKYHAHYEGNDFPEGSVVNIVESRPHSKLKRWEVFGGNKSWFN